MKAVIWAATVLVAGTSVAAAAQEAQTAQAAAEPQQEKKICRTERATGSLTRRTRVCMTEAQWREVNARTYRGVNQMQGESSGGQAVQNNAGAGG